MKFCLGCGVTAHQTDSYCWKCGKVLDEVPCCKCGYNLGSVDKFCPRCGKKVDRGEVNKKDGS